MVVSYKWFYAQKLLSNHHHKNRSRRRSVFLFEGLKVGDRFIKMGNCPNQMTGRMDNYNLFSNEPSIFPILSIKLIGKDKILHKRGTIDYDKEKT